ncbi:MAG: glycoside hydrolase family 2 [Armatimonadota bacterium]|nr:MAG: glycoside hydrolase family 2 [Armatimonadota bacterium]
MAGALVAVGLVSTMITSLDGEWLIAADPRNVGREEQWYAKPIAGAKPTKVPWIIQDAFPGYHGVAWYRRDFTAPRNPHTRGRYLLRFWAVDYQAEVWLNGVHVGGHEGAETPFVLDVTDAMRPGRRNRLAVRVLNPTNEPIDGIALNETPHRNKAVPYWAGASYNHGGIMDSVELLAAPPVRIEDLFVRPDPRTGVIRITANARSAMPGPVSAAFDFAVAPAASGETIATARFKRRLPPGDTPVEIELRVDEPHLWDVDDPYLYRVTARMSRERSKSVDEQSACCGFRDFRFEGGYFRLNQRRIFLRGSHTGNHCPVGLQLPHDPDLLRRDLLYVKTMGFNMIRFIAGMPTRYQLDMCDEIGLLVYEESYAGWLLADSPRMAERFDRSTSEMIRRDRNHPSVVMWGLLNETNDGPVFRHAVDALRLVRSLDDTRMVMLNSGRWDGQLSIGSLSNPGSAVWEALMGDEAPEMAPTSAAPPGGYWARVGDAHAYPRVPHTADTVRFLRTVGEGTKHVFLSEYGIGSAVDLWRAVRHYERLGAAYTEDAQFYRDKLDRFLADWERWRMADTFARPQDYFAESLRKMAGQRTLGLNAIRANRNLVGYSLTGTVDQGMTGEGLFTTFRELKPGTVDALFDGLAPLRWCLFAEPVNVYSGTPVRLEAVLANEDALAPGDYPVRLQVFGPDGAPVLERTVTVTIPRSNFAPHESTAEGGRATLSADTPFAVPVFAEDAAIEGPSGRYRFVATFERGAAATGGEAEFYVADPAEMPPVGAEVVLWGEDAELARWLAEHGIRARSFDPASPPAREVILVPRRPAAPGGADAFGELARRIARGSTAVFLCPEVFRDGDDPLHWLPLANKGAPAGIAGWLYLKDEWAKAHPMFDGLPCGGMMDYTFYREIIPDAVWSGQDAPAEAVAGAIKASQDYSSGLLVAVYELGAGRFVLNTLHIRENLGRHPAAERLLRNMLRYAARDAGKPPADLPPDFDAQLKAMGYVGEDAG